VNSSHAYGIYKFYMANFDTIEIKADKVITYGDIIYLILKGKIIMKLEKDDVLCWNLKPD